MVSLMMGPSSEDREYGLLANSFRPGERVDDLPVTMTMAGNAAVDVVHDRHSQRVGVGSWLAHADREIIKMEQDLISRVRQSRRSAFGAQRSNKAVSGFIGESTTELDRGQRTLAVASWPIADSSAETF